MLTVIKLANHMAPSPTHATMPPPPDVSHGAHRPASPAWPPVSDAYTADSSRTQGGAQPLCLRKNSPPRRPPRRPDSCGCSAPSQAWAIPKWNRPDERCVGVRPSCQAQAAATALHVPRSTSTRLRNSARRSSAHTQAARVVAALPAQPGLPHVASQPRLRPLTPAPHMRPGAFPHILAAMRPQSPSCAAG